MAGVPAEPAVARKTGITKDLGIALPMMVYVFHCSEQMDFRGVDGNRCEYEVIMRALRKLTTQKIVTEDTTLFMGLVGDLFLALDVPRTRELEFENQIRQAMVDLKLQHKNNFILKVVKLVELLEVKHSVFIIGVAGTGKTELWKTLYRAHANLKFKPYLNDIEPNAVTDDELFGVINPTTKGCVDKLFSCLIREQSQMSVDGSKLMILDGDIDPIMWIELLNTAVIDENKVLTLEINERIALTQTMRLPFDIPNLRSTTPGSVFQAGVLYLNHTDHGWNPYVTSWIGTSDNATEKAALLVLLNKYVPICLEVLKTKFKIVTPIPEIMHKQMLCTLLDCLSSPINCPPEIARDVFGTYFVFACLWVFGSAIFPDQLIDWRVEFSKWWLSGFKTITISSSGSVLNYFIDPEPKQFIPWSNRVSYFELVPDTRLQSFNLTMAGVPAEPAVARKTGITKDLGIALPMMVYVFHCSEQMDFRGVDGNRCEYEVIMRALRKLTTQKIVTEDTTLFMGLVGDLFLALDVPRTRELEFENQIRQAMVDLKLQHKNNFILKVVKLVELLEVKHSVFIIGVAGTGKTELWKTLYRAHANLKFKPYLNDIEPNAVTDDELFGVINPTTKGCVDSKSLCITIIFVRVCSNIVYSDRTVFVPDKRAITNVC
eukprot:XP_016659621.1 PREDICTED: dynein beta chain, ciliary-like [Acyrthosiphon pisum]